LDKGDPMKKGWWSKIVGYNARMVMNMHHLAILKGFWAFGYKLAFHAIHGRYQFKVMVMGARIFGEKL